MAARKTNDDQLFIEVSDARTNNLRGIDVRIPHRRMTVVSGLSGSGKSSLAFDTIYAEGQRRYVETLSTYARQFLQQMRRPPVGAVRNIPPSLALRQGNSVNNARSTVGTITELVDHLQVLFASCGHVVCRTCGAEVRPWNTHAIVSWLQDNVAGERVLVLGTVSRADDDDPALVLRQLAAEGHRRFHVGGETVEIDSPEASDLLKLPRWSVVVDRLRVDRGDARLVEAIESAARFGEGGVEVVLWDRLEGTERPSRRFPAAWRCAHCDTVHHAPVTQLFHTQSQIGACAVCQGFGRTTGIDEGKVVPDPRKSIEDGAVVCFQTASYRPMQARLVKACIAAQIPIDIPWLALSTDQRRFVMRGRGREWAGVEQFFESMGEDRYKPHVRIFLARFRGYTDCSACHGSGLSDNARAVRIDGRHMGELLELRIEELLSWADAYSPGESRDRAIEPLVREIRDRLRYLVDAGVGYLTLSRAARTLSGGEMHRVLLATSVGRLLTDTCYVLDEPTAGLHPHDTERLIGVIERLRDAGNTLIVVEHDPDVIARADHIIEIGPGAGEHGGNVVFVGDVAALREADTITGAALRGRTLGPPAASAPSEWLRVSHACLNNLRDVSVAFPIGQLSVVTGVSGSGKSTLVHDVLHQKLLEQRGERSGAELGPAEVSGPAFSEIVMVDQGALGRSSRSCALTFSGAYTPIRELFAAQAAALANGIGAGDFSFNTAGGRCERCEGTGVVDVEMHFIADIELPCDVCDGRRFKEQVLAVHVGQKSIFDVFEMTIDEAVAFFADRAPIVRRLDPLQRVGLGYLRLGQATSRLSGGELQRLKLASYVGATNSALDLPKLFLFDEPTVGLHMRDVDRLLTAMRELTTAGHTVIVVEHNLDLIAQSDWVVDLGPGAGPLGGSVVYQGPLPGLVASRDSITARHLRETFKV